MFAKSMISSDVEEIQEFMEESIKGNNDSRHEMYWMKHSQKDSYDISLMPE